MDDELYNKYEGGIYKPPIASDPTALPANLGVKFSDDIFLLKSFLDQRKIEYKEEDLEKTPFGWGLRIKREKGE